MNKEDAIWGGKPEAFLIYDQSFQDIHAPFLNQLREEGYKLGDSHGNYGCPWIYVNITRKLYAYGMPGIKMMQAIGDHAITLEEFKIIYDIYKKYENKNVFEF